MVNIAENAVVDAEGDKANVAEGNTEGDAASNVDCSW